jgi:regulator of sirC expression with transglutaminase-like and TPR domain
VAPNADRVLFAHVVDRPDDSIQLDVAALMIGEWEYNGLDVSHYLALLDRVAEQVVKTLEAQERTRYGAIRALNKVLFEKLGFRGNEDDYYDPRNSFLNEVIDRRVGIPISLSVVYLEVARRVNIGVDGIAFPGHFLVRYDSDDESLIIDPYHMGLTLDRDELQARLAHASGSDAKLTPDLLEPASKKQILFRMLGNLQGIYRRDGDVQRSISVLERMQVLEPDDARVDQELRALQRRAKELN